MRLFPPYYTGSHATVFGVPVYGNEHRDKWWFPIIKSIAEIQRGINDIYFAILSRCVRRHHVVNTRLSPGWYDVDLVMFHACFELLGRFVTQELGYVGKIKEEKEEAEQPFGKKIEEEVDTYRGYRLHSAGGSDEAAIDLWIWYDYELPIIERRRAADPTAFYRQYGHDYVEELQDIKLRELIEIRRTLWT